MKTITHEMDIRLEGRDEGLEEGIEIGRDGERELLLNLIRKMAENGETEEIPRLSVDEHFLKMKMEQYEMNYKTNNRFY